MINWKFSDVADDDIEDGYYKAKIAQCTQKTSRAGNEMFVFIFQIEGSSFMPVKYQLTEPTPNYSREAVLRDITKIAKCFNVPEGADSPDDFEGRKGFIKISHKEPKGQPGVLIPVISFPAPDKGRDSYMRSVQQKQAELIAQNSANLDSWDPQQEKIPF